MAEEFKNVRRVQTVTRQNLTDELKTKMLGYESADKSLGFKDSAGTMHWYPAEGSNASFNELTLTGFGGSTGYAYIDAAGKIQITNGGDVVQDAINTSTGVISFGGITADTTTFNVGAVRAYFVDNTTDPTVPVITYKEFDAQTSIPVTNILTTITTFIAIDVDGLIHQQSTPYNPTQIRDLIPLGNVVHSNKTTINAVNNSPNVLISPANQLQDLIGAIGVFNISGNIFTANGANLFVNKSEGHIFKTGCNFNIDPKDPHTLTLAGLTNLTTMRYRTQTGVESANTESIDPTKYDLNGTVTTVTGTSWTIQRIYVFPSNLVRIQYGQAIYSNKAAAVAGLSSEHFVTEPTILNNGILRALLVIGKNCTDLTDTSKAVFIEVGKFGSTVGLSSISTGTLQTSYDNSSTPEILTNSTLGAVAIKRGSAADTDNVFEVLNGDGTIEMAINGSGTMTEGTVPSARLIGNAGRIQYYGPDGSTGYDPRLVYDQSFGAFGVLAGTLHYASVTVQADVSPYIMASCNGPEYSSRVIAGSNTASCVQLQSFSSSAVNSAFIGPTTVPFAGLQSLEFINYPIPGGGYNAIRFNNGLVIGERNTLGTKSYDMAIIKNKVAIGTVANTATSAAPLQVGGNIDITGSYLVNGNPLSILWSTMSATAKTIPFFDVNGGGKSVSTFVYDETNERIGVGTNTPYYSIHARSTTKTPAIIADTGSTAYFSYVGAKSELGTIHILNVPSASIFPRLGAITPYTAIYSDTSNGMYIGNVNNQPLSFSTNNYVRMDITGAGAVKIFNLAYTPPQPGFPNSVVMADYQGTLTRSNNLMWSNSYGLVSESNSPDGITSRYGTASVGQQSRVCYELWNNLGTPICYAETGAEIVDSTNTSEDGAFVIKAMTAGTSTEQARFVGGKLLMGTTSTLYDIELRKSKAGTGVIIALGNPTTTGFSQVRFNDNTGDNVANITMDNTNDAFVIAAEATNYPLVLRTQGITRVVLNADGGLWNKTLSYHPNVPTTGEAYQYIKDTKFVICYNDAGTVRYKYLELSGTGVTWVHTTTAP